MFLLFLQVKSVDEVYLHSILIV